METLEVTKTNAIKAFNGSDAKGKKLLTDLYGEKAFSQKITDRVKTVEDACELLGIGELTLYGNPGDEDIISIAAYHKLIIICRALNEGWKPDWSNRSQVKYYPWLEYKTGVGFSGTDCGYSRAGTFVGSRLCLKSSELAMYAGKQFESIYNDFLTL